jgi:hypothetical protein
LSAQQEKVFLLFSLLSPSLLIFLLFRFLFFPLSCIAPSPVFLLVAYQVLPIHGIECSVQGFANHFEYPPPEREKVEIKEPRVLQ